MFPFGKIGMVNSVASRNCHKNEESRLTLKTKRKLILNVIILLHNFRTELVGLNQIATIFNVASYVHVRNYDRISQYYKEIVDSDYEEVNH